VLLLLPVFTYTFFSEVFMHGQTLGKKLRNLKVIRQDGSSPGIGEYFLRWLFRLVDIWVVFFVPGVVGFITMSSNQRGQRLGDLAAGTTLIKNELVTGFDDTIFRALDEGYVMRFPQIETLSDKDVAILKEVLDIGLKNQDPEILHRLANKIKEVAEIKSKLLDSDFLEIVLQDYNYLYGQD
jgi:hypothetical protein